MSCMFLWDEGFTMEGGKFYLRRQYPILLLYAARCDFVGTGHGGTSVFACCAADNTYKAFRLSLDTKSLMFSSSLLPHWSLCSCWTGTGVLMMLGRWAWTSEMSFVFHSGCCWWWGYCSAAVLASSSAEGCIRPLWETSQPSTSPSPGTLSPHQVQ